MYLHILYPLAGVNIDKLDNHDWLRTLIIAARRAGLLSPDLARTADDIRKAGNTAVHRGAVGERKALDVLGEMSFCSSFPIFGGDASPDDLPGSSAKRSSETSWTGRFLWCA